VPANPRDLAVGTAIRRDGLAKRAWLAMAWRRARSRASSAWVGFTREMTWSSRAPWPPQRSAICRMANSVTASSSSEAFMRGLHPSAPPPSSSGLCSRSHAGGVAGRMGRE
jgi:hypothetical protein